MRHGQATFTGLAPGPYTVAITPSDARGNSARDRADRGHGDRAGPERHRDDRRSTCRTTPWTGSYTGTFLFRMSWGGQSCASATPPVATQLLTLSVNGTVVAA